MLLLPALFQYCGKGSEEPAVEFYSRRRGSARARCWSKKMLLDYPLALGLRWSPHRNPDDQEIPCPHLHIYREGFGDKWAIPAPIAEFPNPTDLFPTFEAFMKRCNITLRPDIQLGLF